MALFVKKRNSKRDIGRCTFIYIFIYLKNNCFCFLYSFFIIITVKLSPGSRQTLVMPILGMFSRHKPMIISCPRPLPDAFDLYGYNAPSVCPAPPTTPLYLSQVIGRSTRHSYEDFTANAEKNILTNQSSSAIFRRNCRPRKTVKNYTNPHLLILLRLLPRRLLSHQSD
ncbi:expressed protein [Phakopsora pachyrhizi]|uniref:Expressed protein n=1 Tax=Phakopsora pachyrhizi TaxID=170000 RepID=A0AAV0BFI7_PHAPC|nr:expressed protein [Phakopsora pachyrhizi]